MPGHGSAKMCLQLRGPTLDSPLSRSSVFTEAPTKAISIDYQHGKLPETSCGQTDTQLGKLGQNKYGRTLVQIK